MLSGAGVAQAVRLVSAVQRCNDSERNDRRTTEFQPVSSGGWVTLEATLANDYNIYALPAEIVRPDDPLLISERVAVAAFLAGYSVGHARLPDERRP